MSSWLLGAAVLAFAALIVYAVQQEQRARERERLCRQMASALAEERWTDVLWLADQLEDLRFEQQRPGREGMLERARQEAEEGLRRLRIGEQLREEQRGTSNPDLI